MESPTQKSHVEKRNDASYFQTRDPGFTNQILSQQRSRL